MNESMLCTKTHEYVLEQDNNYEIGITDYAIEQLGDIVFIELPDVNSKFSKNEAFATIESVKAASEIYMPISGTVVEVNEEIVWIYISYLRQKLESVNADIQILGEKGESFVLTKK